MQLSALTPDPSPVRGRGENKVILASSFFLELYAIALAWMQSLGGVRTDEAKYLLNIPYPHPPLARSIFEMTEALPFQEMFWRILLATFIVQAVWLLWDMSRQLPLWSRVSVAAAWLLSTGVLLQAGTIMMAPLTALFGLVLLWLRSRPRAAHPALIGVLWLSALFTAYQAVLFASLVLSLFWKTKMRKIEWFLYFFCPLVLLALYTFSNPLSLASFAVHGTKDATETLLQRAGGLWAVWVLGGSGAVSLLGTVGILRSRDWALVASLVLVSAYVFVGRFDYYAILFTPLFVMGLLILFQTRLVRWQVILPVFSVSALLCFFLFSPSPRPSVARETMQKIIDRHRTGEIQITGNFGHEWQYESPFPVRRFTPEFLDEAQAVVCPVDCTEMAERGGWERLEGPVEVLVRQ